jgi:hypothetical protein
MILGRHATNLRSQEGRQLNDSTRPSVFATIRDRLRDPAVLVIIAVVFLISAVGQAILRAWVGDNSVVITAVLSALGSVFLAAALSPPDATAKQTLRDHPVGASPGTRRDHHPHLGA